MDSLKLMLGSVLALCSVAPFKDAKEYSKTAESVAPVQAEDPWEKFLKSTQAYDEKFDDLQSQVASTNSSVRMVSQNINDVLEKLEAQEQKAAVTPKVDFQKVNSCVCTCDCPTLDQIRQMFREELSRSPARASTAVSSSSSGFQVYPGERIIAIDGVPVSNYSPSAVSAPSPVYSTPAPVYSAPVFVPSFSSGGCANGSCYSGGSSFYRGGGCANGTCGISYSTRAPMYMTPSGPALRSPSGYRTPIRSFWFGKDRSYRTPLRAAFLGCRGC